MFGKGKGKCFGRARKNVWEGQGKMFRGGKEKMIRKSTEGK